MDWKGEAAHQGANRRCEAVLVSPSLVTAKREATAMHRMGQGAQVALSNAATGEEERRVASMVSKRADSWYQVGCRSKKRSSLVH